ncbi:copper resistance CopC/CopD family protein [Streptomyces virginiae]|uniref:copper resistance CopC/CopD family protein n=1 Tax=Streptomyces virginiae TaxID=1961 RepID=UPI0036313CD6
MRPVPRPARTSLTVLALLAAVCALLVGGAGSAFAHAGLSGSDPADSTVLKEAPRQVTLTFTESVTFSEDSLRVLSPENRRVNPAPAQYADGKSNTARVQLSDELPQGTYTVAWRVVSADGHPISGAFVFSIGKPSETAAVVPDGSLDDSAVGRLYAFFRYLAYSGLALLVGAAAFVAVCLPGAGGERPVRRLLAAGWAVLVVSTVALLLLRGPYETGGGPTSVFDLSQLGRTVVGRPGAALVVRLVLLAAAAVLLGRCAVRLRGRDDGRGEGPDDGRGDGAERRDLGRGVRRVGAALALGLAFTWAAAEHASAGIQVPLAVPVAVLHLVAMGVWLGGLITLVIVLRSHGAAGRTVPADAVGRFSTMAFAAVAVLVGTGVYQSWRQVGSWEALTTTSYGRTLLVKVAVVVVVLWVASYSRRWTARLLHEAAPAAGTRTVPEPERVKVTVGAPDAPGGGGVRGAAGPPSPEADVDQRAHQRGLRRTVAVEAALGVVVLAVSTLLTGTQPSRAAGESAAAAVAAAQEPQAKVATVPFDMGKAGHQGAVQITLAPGRVGENTVEAVVFSADGGLATVPELRLTLTQEALGIGPIDARLKNQKGFWAVYDLQLPMPGEWTLNITVRTSEIDQVTVRGSVHIAPLPGRPAA